MLKTKVNVKNLLMIGAWSSLILLMGLFVFFMLRRESVQEIDRSAMRAALPQTALDTMEEGDADTLHRLYGLSEGQYDFYLIYSAPDVMDVSELLILRCPDKDSRLTALSAVEKVRAEQLATFKTYAPEQAALLQNARLLTRGNYLFYAVGEHADALQSAFERAVK